MWIEINDKLINLEHVKEVSVNASQFGGKRLCIDGVSYDVKNADALYGRIKSMVLEKHKNPYDITKLLHQKER